jgi:hypothetical protein
MIHRGFATRAYTAKPAPKWGSDEARSRTRTDGPFLTIDPEARKGGSRRDTSDTRLSRKAAAFIEWLSAGGDSVCTT